MKKICFGILGSILFLASCNEDETVGISLRNDDDLINAIFVDTFNVELSTYLDNRFLSTYNGTRLLMGSYTDPLLGTTSSTAYIEAKTGADPIDGNPICDSISVQIAYYRDFRDDPNYYGDTNSLLTLNVFELAEDFSDDSTYYSTSSLSTESSSVGTRTFLPHPNDGEFTIPLNVAYGQSLINSINTETFDDDHFGIAIQAPESNSALFATNPSSSNNKIKIYYHTDDSSLDSLEIDIRSNNRFHQLISDRSTSDLNALSGNGDDISTSLSSNRAFIQSGTGLGCKISIPSLPVFINQNPNIIINKAELEVFIDPSTTGSINTEVPGEVLLTKIGEDDLLIRNENNAFELVLNDSLILTVGGGDFNYNQSELKFTMPISFHIQNLVSGGQDYTDLVIYSNELNRISRAVIFDNSASPELRPKLNLYFTEQ